MEQEKRTPDTTDYIIIACGVLITGFVLYCTVFLPLVT